MSTKTQLREIYTKKKNKNSFKCKPFTILACSGIEEILNIKFCSYSNVFGI